MARGAVKKKKPMVKCLGCGALLEYKKVTHGPCPKCGHGEAVTVDAR